MDDHKRQRLEITDRMLKGEPVSFLQIAKEFENELHEYERTYKIKDKPSDRNLSVFYTDVFRKDIQAIREILKTTIGLSPDMLETVGNKRNMKYHYRDSTFSILPYLDYRYSARDYKNMDRALDLMRSTLPEQVFNLVEFSLKSRVEYDFGETEKSIDYGENLYLKGRDRLPHIYKVLNKKAIKINYKTFKDEAYEFLFYPYLLKQFNNRWFLFGRHEERCNDYWNVPVDRIVKMDELSNVKFKNRPDNYMKYFDDFIGVSEKVWTGEKGGEEDTALQNGDNKASKKISITLRVDNQGTWGRMITKRLHWSQTSLDNGFCNGCGRLKIEIIPNIEFYNKLMELGENVVVESPQKVREIIKKRLQDTLKKYE